MNEKMREKMQEIIEKISSPKEIEKEKQITEKTMPVVIRMFQEDIMAAIILLKTMGLFKDVDPFDLYAFGLTLIDTGVRQEKIILKETKES